MGCTPHGPASPLLALMMYLSPPCASMTISALNMHCQSSMAMVLPCLQRSQGRDITLPRTRNEREHEHRGARWTELAVSAGSLRAGSELSPTPRWTFSVAFPKQLHIGGQART